MTIVVKVGTGVLTHEADASLNTAALVRLVTALSELMAEGHKLVFVSSGAVGSGVSALGLGAYPQDLATKQACAAIGQTRLMRIYEELFSHFGIHVAQVLLTADDFRSRRENVGNTLDWLLRRNDVIPIINENDTVSVEELKFGDNDMLSCYVAELVGADALVLMTGVDGLYPPGDRGVGFIERVDDIESVFDFASPDEKGKFSMGGMRSKLTSVRRALNAGIDTYIVNGARPERVGRVLAGEALGTYFPSKGKNKKS